MLDDIGLDVRIDQNMMKLLVAASALVAIGPAAALPVSLPAVGAPARYQLVVERQVIIRVPARANPINQFSPAAPPRRAAPVPMQVWTERKAPRCVAANQIFAIHSAQRDSIELLTREGQRLRARLPRGCQGIEFYEGFYLRPAADGRLCADRDIIHARSGAQCKIDRFRLLVPAGAPK